MYENNHHTVTLRRKTKLIEIKEGGTFAPVGAGQGFHKNGRFYSILEKKRGGLQGQLQALLKPEYTLLISGKGKYVRYDGGSITETSLARGSVVIHLSEVTDDLVEPLNLQHRLPPPIHRQ